MWVLHYNFCTNPLLQSVQMRPYQTPGSTQAIFRARLLHRAFDQIAHQVYRLNNIPDVPKVANELLKPGFFPFGVTRRYI